MAQTDTGLNDTGLGRGKTTHYAITYDDSLSTADGRDRANALMAACESDYSWMATFFPGLSLPFSLPIDVQLVTGPYAGAGWGPPITVKPGNGEPIDLVRYLLVSEVVEMFMKSKANGWGYSFGDSNEGSKGEALSRYLGYRFLDEHSLDKNVLGYSGSTFFVSNFWLNTTRADFVNNNPDDNAPDATTGCTTLFLYYLEHQLQFAINDIINNGGQTLGDVYRSLTSDTGDPFPFFKRLVDTALPGTSQISTTPNLDDPFPIGILSAWIDKNTFGRDEVQDAIATQGGRFSSAVWLVLEGFSIDSFNALGIAVPTPTWASSLNGVQIVASPASPGGSTPASPIPQFEDPAHPKRPQRIRFSFDMVFTDTSAFPNTGDGPVFGEIQASAQQGGSAVPGASTSAFVELIAGEDPYFANIDPTHADDVWYLSQDLRVFSTIAGQSALPGAPAMTSDPYASIQSLLQHLNGNASFTQPATTDPLNALPGQGGYETADSSVSPVDAQHHQRYNFAIARVRLRGTHGAQAPNVRVFFRMFVAQSCDTDFQPSGAYKSQLGTSGADSGHPVFPLASNSGLSDPSGNSLRTIPFFATDSAGTHDYDGTTQDANIRTIEIPTTDDSVWAYFGCFLDMYDASNNARFGGTHHCLVAEIAYDDAPIPTSTPTGTVPSPANFDKLAQRNLQITLSENPKSPDTHIIPQAFDVRASRPLAGPSTTPGTYPDELMIDWGATPPGSAALIYWPQVDAAEVISLADSLYGSHLLSVREPHTVECMTTQGVSYIPIPPASGTVSLAGLLTIELPSTVKHGQRFDIVVRRVTSRRLRYDRPGTHSASVVVGGLPQELIATGEAAAIDPAPSKPDKHEPQMAAGRDKYEVIVREWRQVSGAFQVRIPVTDRTVMLRPEEDALAVIRWRLDNMPASNRWRPVLQRYLDYVTARVKGLGGDPERIPASLEGASAKSDFGGPRDYPGRRDYPGLGEHPARHAFTGKVDELIYDRFGDLRAFTLRLNDGHTHTFRAREPQMERLLHRAWDERSVVSVEADSDGWPEDVRIIRPH